MTVEIINIDCMEYMAGLSDKAFDLAVVDPPFFKGVTDASFYGTGLSGSGVKRGVYKRIDNWDKEIPKQKYYKELCRVSINQIIWGINYFHFKNVPHGRLIWDKINDHSTYSKAEIASNSFIKSVQMFRYRWCGFQQGATCQVVERRIHPTQKPIALYQWIYQNYAKPGQRILDTHLGSGSSAIAAHYAGLDFVGCELDKEYFEAARKRFDQQTRQKTLFAPEPVRQKHNQLNMI